MEKNFNTGYTKVTTWRGRTLIQDIQKWLPDGGELLIQDKQKWQPDGEEL
jgi:hypothetical protein